MAFNHMALIFNGIPRKEKSWKQTEQFWQMIVSQDIMSNNVTQNTFNYRQLNQDLQDMGNTTSGSFKPRLHLLNK